MSMIKVKGVSSIISALQKAGKDKIQAVSNGLLMGGKFLQSESQKVVPVLTGNLRGSAFTRRIDDKTVAVGYSASYAIYVHENLDAQHKTGKQAKFLEEPARTKRSEILKVIQRYSK